jgi:hypothetical protein
MVMTLGNGHTYERTVTQWPTCFKKDEATRPDWATKKFLDRSELEPELEPERTWTRPDRSSPRWSGLVENWTMNTTGDRTICLSRQLRQRPVDAFSWNPPPPPPRPPPPPPPREPTEATFVRSTNTNKADEHVIKCIRCVNFVPDWNSRISLECYGNLARLRFSRKRRWYKELVTPMNVQWNNGPTCLKKCTYLKQSIYLNSIDLPYRTVYNVL